MFNRSTILVLAALWLLLAPGCAGLSSGQVPSSPLPGRQQSLVEGDFDDINAVVAGILPKFHVIDIPQASDNPDIRLFKLRMLNDAPGVLAFEKQPDGRIRIRCALGRFPNPKLEKKLTRALAERFEQLRGQVAAPITFPEQK